MIPNHKQFLAAVAEKKKVSVRFYSTADSAVVDLICAPLGYGPAEKLPEGVNGYQFWNYAGNHGSHDLVLLPEQILSLSVLGSVFDPAEFSAPPLAAATPPAL